MLIINSKQIYHNQQPVHDSSNFKSNNSAQHTKNRQEQNILHWIQNQHSTYPNSRKINKIQQLKSGVILAQILSDLLPAQIIQQQKFLDNIQINNLNQINCIHNLSVILYVTRKCYQSFNGQFGLDLTQLRPEQLYANTQLMKAFVLKVIMKISLISKKGTKNYVQKINQDCNKIQTKKPLKNQKSYERQKLSKHQLAQIQDLSQIANLQSLQFQSKNSQQFVKYQSKSIGNRLHTETLSQKYKADQNKQNYITQKKNSLARDQIYLQQQRQNKISQLLDWIVDTYNLPIQDLQAHQLLGELTNRILGNLRLNQQVVKPIHFQMGSACVYRKVVDEFFKCERINKSNLIQMSSDIQSGIIKQQIYWNVIQDIWCMINNKISSIQLYENRSISQQKFKPAYDELQQRQTTQEDQKQNKPILMNLNLQNNQKPNTPQKKSNKPYHPLYEQETIEKVQMWLQQVGFNYSLGKSKQIKTIKLNPLLNGTLMGSLLIRLKIGKLILIKQPKDLKQVSKNMQQIKKALNNRGYQCGRKLDMFRPGINFYIGIIGEIHEIYNQKQNIKKEGLADNKRYKKQCQNIYKIYNKEKEEINNWINREFSITLDIEDDIDVSLLFQVFQACINITLLRQTTSKIVQINIARILQELRNLGLSQYYNIKTQDITNKYSQVKQDIKWMILKDLKSIVCGSRGFVQYLG